MVFEPIAHTDLSEQVYRQIREMILSGELKAGEKLAQEHIAEKLGVSRMPLHKAFVRLEEEYLVKSIPRRGIFIRKPDVQEIIDAFECREGLEGIAARRAAQNLSTEQIDYLESLFTPFRGKSDIDPVAYQEADREFHQYIISASGNKVMQKLNHIGNVLIGTYPKGIILSLEESLLDHEKIVAAFRERDLEKSEALIRSHSRKAIEILQKTLENRNNTDEKDV